MSEPSDKYCPICGKAKERLVKWANGKGSTRPVIFKTTSAKSCSDPICVAVAKKFVWSYKLRKKERVLEGYTYVHDGGHGGRADFVGRAIWRWWEFSDRIQQVRIETIALMKLRGEVLKIERSLSNAVLTHIEKNYCSPCTYILNQFNYEKSQSNTYALRNHGWPDLLLSGITPKRDKSSKHAQHH